MKPPKPAAPSDARPSAQSAAPSLTLPDRPSIAVLPFVNLSGDPSQDYFVDGMVEDIIAAMSRYALAGRTDEARKAVERLQQLDPSFRASNLTKYVPISRPQDVAVFAGGLRKAGLPD